MMSIRLQITFYVYNSNTELETVLLLEVVLLRLLDWMKAVEVIFRNFGHSYDYDIPLLF